MESSDEMKFECPECGKKLAVDARFAGKKARCPQCHNVFEVPALDNQRENIPLASESQHTHPSPDVHQYTHQPIPPGAFRQGYSAVPPSKKTFLSGWRLPVVISGAAVMGIVILLLVVGLIVHVSSSKGSTTKNAVRADVSDLLNYPDKYKGRIVVMDVAVKYVSPNRIFFCSFRNYALEMWMNMREGLYDEVLEGNLHSSGHIRMRIWVRLYDDTEIEKIKMGVTSLDGISLSEGGSRSCKGMVVKLLLL